MCCSEELLCGKGGIQIIEVVAVLLQCVLQYVLQRVLQQCCKTDTSKGVMCTKASSHAQFVAVYCSVLLRVAVCCSVLQCVAVCCSVLQCVE